MNNATKNILSAVTGALVGSGLTYVVVNRILVKRYEIWANEEIAKFRHDYQEMHRTLESEDYIQPKAAHERPDHVSDLTEEQVMEALAQQVDDAESKEGYTDYTRPEAVIINSFDRGLQVDDSGIVIIPDPEVEESYEIFPGEAYRITQDQYFNEETYSNGKALEKDTAKYYALDNVLVASDGSVMEVEYSVGERHLHMFGWGSPDTNLVYVRNEKTGTDWEIIELDAEYVVAVLKMPSNLTDDDVRSRRRKKNSGDNE